MLASVPSRCRKRKHAGADAEAGVVGDKPNTFWLNDDNSVGFNEIPFVAANVLALKYVFIVENFVKALLYFIFGSSVLLYTSI